jgi:hypothetical protein
MIQRLNLNIALNSLSIGQCGYNLLRELYRRKIQCTIFPRGPVNLEAYKVESQFGAWIERSINTRYQKVDRKVPTFACWHIAGSEMKPSDRQFLLSFHETDSPTEHEVNILNQQDYTFFSSSWSVDNFRTYGAQNVGFVPLGLDEDFVPATNRLISTDIIHWILVGKAEMRKNTQLIIQTWIKRYGGSAKHNLTVCITSPFFNEQQMNGFYAGCFGGNKPFNVNVLPYLKTNAEVNHLINSADIDLSGFSSAEGWGLPSFTATALGKWSIVSNCTAHKDWATSDNAILVEPSGMRPVYDGVFFAQGSQFSQGNHFSFTQEQLVSAMEVAEKKARTPNVEGAKLRESHTWAKTADAILAKIGD